jgi:hypothetical protein
MLHAEGKGSKPQYRLVDHRLIRWIIAYDENGVYTKYDLVKSSLRKLDKLMEEV